MRVFQNSPEAEWKQILAARSPRIINPDTFEVRIAAQSASSAISRLALKCLYQVLITWHNYMSVAGERFSLQTRPLKRLIPPPVFTRPHSPLTLPHLDTHLRILPHFKRRQVDVSHRGVVLW